MGYMTSGSILLFHLGCTDWDAHARSCAIRMKPSPKNQDMDASTYIGNLTFTLESSYQMSCSLSFQICFCPWCHLIFRLKFWVII